VWPDQGASGFAPDDLYVRRFWTAAVGPGAVADLLRLIAAAQKGDAIRRPLHLATLAREGLVLVAPGHVWVRTRIPPLQRKHLRRFPPALKAEHRAAVSTRQTAGSQNRQTES
jgi:hypothetical protein